MKRVILLIAVVLILVTGCQRQETSFADGGNETITPSNTIPVENGADTDTYTDTGIDADIDTEQNLVNSLNDLYRSGHTLKIQKNGESTFYDAAKPLVFIIGDMLSKVEEVSTSTVEGNEKIGEFEYDYYDYRLRFSGVKDILFTRDGNVLRFEGEKEVYCLWGSADSLWDSLVFDDRNNTVDIVGEEISVMTNVYNEDMDGDGKAENIELVYERGRTEDFKGNLIVRINGSEAVVIEGDEWYTKPYRIVGQMPEIKFLQEENGNSKVLLVIYSWATNGIGSTGVINAYKYVSGHISEVKVEDAEGIIKCKGDNVVNVDFPSLNRNMDLTIDNELFMKVSGNEDFFGLHPLWYIVKDYNGDGREDLCCVSVMNMYPFVLYRQYSYFKYKDGKIRPVQVFVDSSYFDDERKSYLKGCILDLIEYKGYLTIGDKGITDENFQPYYEYTHDEIIGVLEELQKDKILKLKGDRMYINF